MWIERVQRASAQFEQLNGRLGPAWTPSRVHMPVWTWAPLHKTIRIFSKLNGRLANCLGTYHSNTAHIANQTFRKSIRIHHSLHEIAINLPGPQDTIVHYATANLLYSHSGIGHMEGNWGSHCWNSSLCAADSLYDDWKSLKVRWNLVITRYLGPWKLPCYIRFLIISG